MHLQVITLRYDPARGMLDDGELRAFLRDKVVLAHHEHFFMVGALPHLALVISHRLGDPSPADGPLPLHAPPASRSPEAWHRRDERAGNRTDDLRATLEPAQRVVFDLLRAWRSELAREDDVPAYAILSNKHLLAISVAAPTSTAALERVAGLGRKRVERHGPAILDIVRGATAPSTGAPAPGASAPAATDAAPQVAP